MNLSSCNSVLCNSSYCRNCIEDMESYGETFSEKCLLVKCTSCSWTLCKNCESQLIHCELCNMKFCNCCILDHNRKTHSMNEYSPTKKQKRTNV